MTGPHRTSWLACVSLALLSGLLLGLSGPPFHLPWLQLVAWIPFVWVLLRPGVDWLRAMVAGAVFGIGQNLVLAWVLEFPPGFAALLIAALSSTWLLLGLMLGFLLRRLGAGW